MLPRQLNLMARKLHDLEVAAALNGAAQHNMPPGDACPLHVPTVGKYLDLLDNLATMYPPQTMIDVMNMKYKLYDFKEGEGPPVMGTGHLAMMMRAAVSRLEKSASRLSFLSFEEGILLEHYIIGKKQLKMISDFILGIPCDCDESSSSSSESSDDEREGSEVTK